MKIFTNFLILLFLYSFFSCSNDNASDKLLRKAQTLIENEPSKALVLLDSIDNPEKMDKDDYMQFIVARTQAKYKTYQDVTSDTLIFEAQKYFDGKGNVEQATLAHFYAGGVYREKQMPDKALKSFLNAGYYANKCSKKPRFSGIISENIGTLYLEQSLMDSAVYNYREAVNYYKLQKDSTSIMKALNQIGRAYEDLHKLDSAYSYFNSALQIAETIQDKQLLSILSQNLGVTSYGMAEYDKAITYFKLALSQSATNERQVRKIYLYLLKTYNQTNDLSSAKEFALKVEASIPDVTDLHTKNEMYAALSNYYKLTGDYKQALHFNELGIETIQQIADKERPVDMIIADTDFRVEQKNRVYGELQSDFFLFKVLTIAAAILILVFVVINYRQNKKDKKIIKKETEKYDLIRRHLEASNRDYDRIQAEIKEMLEDNQEDKE